MPPEAPKEQPILIALGANVPGPMGSPKDSLAAAVERLPTIGVAVESVSSFLRTPAFPPSDQPDFFNGVAIGRSALTPTVILAGLHRIERELGRVRSTPWEPRPIDLDLLAVGDVVSEGYWVAAANGDRPGDPGGAFILPHPRLHLRSFVLQPLCEIAPDWIHPALGQPAKALLRKHLQG